MKIIIFSENIRLGITIVVSGCLVSLFTMGVMHYRTPTTSQSSKLLPVSSQTLLSNSHAQSNKPVLVEFMDYQCPPCKSLQPKLNEWLGRHAFSVEFSVRNYPLSMHPFAQQAAEVAEYARNLGKFEETHLSILAQTTLDASVLNKLEASLAKSETAVSSARSKAKKTVDEDLRVALQLELTGTPSLLLMFPNGKVYQIYSFDQADALIKQEAPSVAQR